MQLSVAQMAAPSSLNNETHIFVSFHNLQSILQIGYYLFKCRVVLPVFLVSAIGLEEADRVESLSRHELL